MGRLATARRIKTAGRPRQPLLRQNRRFSSPHPFGRAGLARFEPRRLVSTSERRLPGENVCYLRNLGTDEPLTSMNGMARVGQPRRYHRTDRTDRTDPDRLSFRILYRSSSQANYVGSPGAVSSPGAGAVHGAVRATAGIGAGRFLLPFTGPGYCVRWLMNQSRAARRRRPGCPAPRTGGWRRAPRPGRFRSAAPAGPAVEVQHHLVMPADDEQCRCGHGREPGAGKIGAAAAGHQGRDAGAGLGRRPQRRRGRRSGRWGW